MIGEALVKSSDPKSFIASLRDHCAPPQTFVKICGLRDPALAAEAVKMGADYIGIMMHEASSRYVTIETAREIVSAVKQANGTPVAIFVDTPAEAMKTICEDLNIDVVQLHGDISRKAHPALPQHIKRIYVMHVNADGSVQYDPNNGVQYLNKERDLLLFDGITGGSGKQFSYENFHMNLPTPPELSYFLAGGLTPENVASAITATKPYGVDVSSGVESSPGVKEKTRIKRFIENAKRN